MAAAILGTERRSDQIMAQRQKMYQQAQQSLIANIGILGEMSKYVQAARPEEQQEVLKKLREAYLQNAPGGEALFDATVGNSGSGPGLLQAALQDEGAKLLLANGASAKDLQDYLTSPAKLEEAKAIQDQKLIGSVRTKIERLLATKDPTLRAELQKIQKDGKITAAEIASLNELGSVGPEGTRLLPMELDTLTRKQDEIAQIFPDLFATTEEFATERKLRQAEASAARQTRAKEAIEAEFAAAVGDNTAKLSAGGKKRDQSFASEVYTPFVTEGGFADAEKNLEQLDGVISELEGGASVSGPFQGQFPDSVRAATNPQALDIKDRIDQLAQSNLRLVLGGQFAQKEGEQLIKREYNPLLPEEKNLERLKRLRDQVASKLAAKREAADYFERNSGSLEGFEGQFRGNPKSQEVGQRKLQGDKPQTVEQDGVTYTLNPETGEYE